MTPLRQQMLDAMAVRGLAVRTQETYVDSLGRMARYFKRSPAVLTAQDAHSTDRGHPFQTDRGQHSRRSRTPWAG